MTEAPVLKPREMAAILKQLGFAEVRQRGSHKQFRHPDGRGTPSPDQRQLKLQTYCLIVYELNEGLTRNQVLLEEFLQSQAAQ